MMSGLSGFHQLFWLSSPPGAPLKGTNVLPPSVDLKLTMSVTTIVSASFGYTCGTTSLMREVGRLSVVARAHVAPASSDRYRPVPPPPASSVAYSRRGSDGATASSALIT